MDYQQVKAQGRKPKDSDLPRLPLSPVGWQLSYLGVIDGLAGLVEWTEVSRAEELTKEVNNWCLSYQTKVRGDSPSL